MNFRTISFREVLIYQSVPILFIFQVRFNNQSLRTMVSACRVDLAGVYPRDVTYYVRMKFYILVRY